MIRIIKGVYGHVPNQKTGIVVPKTSKAAPISQSPEQEKRLGSNCARRAGDTRAQGRGRRAQG